MNLMAANSLYAGGPGSGCNPAVGKCGRTVTFYHGTTDDSLKGIAKKGLSPKAKKWNPFTRNMPKEKNFVYLSQTKENALYYALWKADDKGGKPHILTVELPEDLAKGLKRDRYDDVARKHVGTIPAKYITRIEKVPNNPAKLSPEYQEHFRSRRNLPAYLLDN